jgi:hypothetical protein
MASQGWLGRNGNGGSRHGHTRSIVAWRNRRGPGRRKFPNRQILMAGYKLQAGGTDAGPACFDRACHFRYCLAVKRGRVVACCRSLAWCHRSR